ncbi:Nuclear export mediator factor NEMF homolog [Eumeta japonica]|uniref:Nuclear export mediator factor NEMF homolog n=1 Tax=Eumeta variegata TaxID=151549 RepID=A0A4C1YR71_EUMVA|nr:Nuclear export mediator factor NEMF homolog [Eumeta japonica]
MKTRFSTYDIVCNIAELQRLIGMRVNQVYDIDNKAYLIRLQRSEEKSVLLLESGNRFHTTHFEWPKNVAPSGFTMKLRKHLKNKRLESFSQLGIDRIVELQFGTGEVAFHVILELYDKGNIILTDFEWTILNVLRPHVEGDRFRFAVKEKYPLDRAKTWVDPPMGDALKEILAKSRPGDNLKKILNPNVEYGPGIIDHVLLENDLSGNMKISNSDGAKGFNVEKDLHKLEAALRQAESLMQEAKTKVAKGYVIQKKEEKPNPDGEKDYFLTNVEFHPMLYAQLQDQPYIEYDSFDRAIDEFFSALEGQKIDLKTIKVEREALKKLDNVKKDHEKRLTELEKTQKVDRDKAELISRNQELVDQARLAIQTAIANQLPWEEIQALLKTAQERKDPIASVIKHLKLNINHITLLLNDPYAENSELGHDEDNDSNTHFEKLKPMLVDIDLSLTAFANARRYYDQKRNAAKKQQKTIESHGKALKSAERKTKQTLKEVQTISSINKARKTYWFEKFFWFISSDNYLVIGGRDQQQNELIVKRYMKVTDIYVHADLSGASSIIVKNPSGQPLPPRTLNEAGQAAVAYSVAWEAKVLTTAWWVNAHQVSKSAPTGEYLTTGSFMIRGRKNYLLPQHLMLGFSFMFRLEDSCIERHKDERRPFVAGDDNSDVTSTQEHDEEIPVSDDGRTNINIEIGIGIQSRTRLKSYSGPKIDIENRTTIEMRIDNEKSDQDEKNDNLHQVLDTITEETTRVEIKDDTLSLNPSKDSDLQESNKSDSDSSDEAFPDTHIKVDHGTGKVIIEHKTRTASEVSDDKKDDLMMKDDKPLTFPPLPKDKSKKAIKGQKQEHTAKEEPKSNKDGLKRGQKYKLKKIKKKYGDLDEEDKAMWEIQQHVPANTNKESKKAKKNADTKKSKAPIQKSQKIPQPAPLILEGESDPEEPEIEVETQGVDADTELLAQLTGCPFPEDELLFAVPVVAPYSALLNYKYKVKLTPGTGKRGKSAKTAVQVFLRDKTCSPREKDLLKAVKDEDAARNFPGKVKLSAPQLHKRKK